MLNGMLYLFHPDLLKEKNICLVIILQKPEDYVVTYPGRYPFDQEQK